MVVRTQASISFNSSTNIYPSFYPISSSAEKRGKNIGKERKKIFFTLWSVKVVMVAKYHGPSVFLVLLFWSEKKFKNYPQKTRIFLKFKIVSFGHLLWPTLRVKTSIKCFFDVPRHCTWSVCKEKIASAKSIFFDFCPDISLHRSQWTVSNQLVLIGETLLFEPRYKKKCC